MLETRFLKNNLSKMNARVQNSRIITSFFLRLFSSANAMDENPNYDEIIKTIFFNVLGCAIVPSILDRIGPKKALLCVDILFFVSLVSEFLKYEEGGKGVVSILIRILRTTTPFYISEGMQGCAKM